MTELQINNDDEIDLKELFLTLWHGKIYILFFTALFLFFASMYLQDAQRKYLVEYKLKPVGDSLQRNSLTGLSGFASLAGIQLPSKSMNDFIIFKELISSVDVSKIIFENKVLIQEIFAGEWNQSQNSFSEPSKSKTRSHISELKRLLTGNNKVNYNPPNAKRLSDYISQNIKIKEDKKTGFLTITAKSSKPDMLLSLIVAASETSDKIMRQRYINFSKEPLSFYKEKLRTARSREHREALAELISKEEQKLMLASVGKYFTAEPYIEPAISSHPITPNPKQILLISIILGVFTGCSIVIMSNVKMRSKK